jgi:hypothetical protein
VVSGDAVSVGAIRAIKRQGGVLELLEDIGYAGSKPASTILESRTICADRLVDFVAGAVIQDTRKHDIRGHAHSFREVYWVESNRLDIQRLQSIATLVLA